MATVLRTLATLVLAAPSVQGWNAASVWGVATNASYFPSIANVLFEISLEDAVVAHATNGATGYVQHACMQLVLKDVLSYPFSAVTQSHHTSRCDC